MENIICKNCGTSFLGKFCPNCGQKANTKRLDWGYIKDEFKYTFLHVNKGLFYTIKELFKRPGETINEFIDGKRVNHYKPILLVFVLAGLSSLLSKLFIDIDKAIVLMETNDTKKLKIDFKEFMLFTVENYALIEILLLPIISLFSWIAFRNAKLNYIEHIIKNSFVSGQRLIITISLFPLTYIILEYTNLYSIFSILLSLISVIASTYCYYKFYKSRMVIGTFILRFLLFIFFGFTLYVLSIIIFVVHTFVKNPELLQPIK